MRRLLNRNKKRRTKIAMKWTFSSKENNRRDKKNREMKLKQAQQNSTNLLGWSLNNNNMQTLNSNIDSHI